MTACCRTEMLSQLAAMPILKAPVISSALRTRSMPAFHQLMPFDSSRLTWHPVAIDLAGFPSSEAQSTCDRLSSCGTSNIHPPFERLELTRLLMLAGIRSAVNRVHTQLSHYCRFSDLSSKDSTFLHASLLSKHVVSSTWLQALLESTQLELQPPDLNSKSKEDMAKLRNQNKTGSDQSFWGFSKLEQDFEKHWPVEPAHFPKWSTEQEQSALANTKRWSSISTQSKLFTGLTFIVQGPKGSPKVKSPDTPGEHVY